ncbi:uncharacterized protein V1516DRAFT_671538 [Lipomyces oligophaga]|uniref:uncharacterized protein n=1 Tax=Lipomyces oligophaga TaxID=45792 RepID=UPI0034CDEE2B
MSKLVPKRYRSLRRQAVERPRHQERPIEVDEDKISTKLLNQSPPVPEIPSISVTGKGISPRLSSSAQSSSQKRHPEIITKGAEIAGQSQNRITVEIFDSRHQISVLTPPTTTATAFIQLALASAKKEKLDNLAAFAAELSLVEISQPDSIQRTLYPYELVSWPVSCWNSNYSMLRIVPESSTYSAHLDLLLINSDPASAEGLMFIKDGLGKWNERMATIKDGYLCVSKISKLRSKSFKPLLKLSQFNPYNASFTGSSFTDAPTSNNILLRHEHNPEKVYYIALNHPVDIGLWFLSFYSVRGKEVLAATKRAQVKYSKLIAEPVRVQQGPLISRNNSHATPIIAKIDIPAIEKSSVNLQNPIKRSVSTRTKPYLHADTKIGPNPGLNQRIENQISLTKDSLLDRLVHGESFANKSIVNDSGKIERNSDRSSDDPYTSLQPATISLGRQASRYRSKSVSRSKSIVHKLSHTSLSQPSQPVQNPQLSYLPTKFGQPSKSSSAGFKNPWKAQGSTQREEDDDDVPLYRKMQQLDFQSASNNPFRENADQATSNRKIRRSTSHLDFHSINGSIDNNPFNDKNILYSSPFANGRTTCDIVDTALNAVLYPNDQYDRSKAASQSKPSMIDGV